MQNFRSELHNALLEAINKAVAAGDLPTVDKVGKVLVQYPPKGQENLGDYSSPVALSIGKMLGKKPADVAEILLKHFISPNFLEKAEVVQPGFINFKLSVDILGQKIDDVVEEGTHFGTSKLGEGKTVDLEFVSANPTGLPTFGNGRALFWADTLGKVLEKSGYVVTREYYINDEGNQVRLYGESVLRRILQRRGLDVEYPENLYQGEEVKGIAKKVEEIFIEDHGHTFSEEDLANEEFVSKLARAAVDVTVSETRKMIEDVCKVNFDVWFSEKTLHEKGDVQKVVEELKSKGLTFEQEGAIWFKSTKFGDDKDRVLVRADGRPTYFAPDIAYHRNKLSRGFQIIADFWGADHHGDIKRLLGGLEALGEDVAKIRIILAQMVSVIEGGERKKMSKRAGTSIPLNEMVQRAGLSASRFFLTMTSLSSHMDFDLELATEQSDRNPVYYVQYAYVRLVSILRKAKEINVMDGELLPQLGVRTRLNHRAEIALMRTLFRYTEVVEDVAESWDVQRLPHYAIELSRAIHLFYDSVPVLNAETRELQSARLTLALAAKTTIGNLLDLMGVEKLNVM